MSSIHNTLEKVRKPRIHIKYDVETEDGIEQKQLPFVVGVMGDFAGSHPAIELKSLKERQFINIDQDNFNHVMQQMAPGLAFKVKNTLTDQDSELAIHLVFNKMEDFEPDQIVKQIKPLHELKQARDRLRDLLSKTDRSDELEQILEHTLKNSKTLMQFAKELNINQEEQQ